MSRSRKKTPVVGVCCGEDRMGEWKRGIRRSFRRSTKMRLRDLIAADGSIDEETLSRVPKSLDEIEDEWSSPTDGKQYLHPDQFDPTIRRKLLQK